eukprot:gb/GECG01004808.1/.p1 GENE.gb/GECG01004808.1/~~gb/GECG01004808.1/.p1  ORF type:complete len:100 (+),score=11.32 gb/GECG01004808.1/:1-300(+)
MHARTLNNVLVLRRFWLGWLNCSKRLPESPTKEGQLLLFGQLDVAGCNNDADENPIEKAETETLSVGAEERLSSTEGQFQLELPHIPICINETSFTITI